MRRILSIDGGGIKGVFPAAFLAEVEDMLEDGDDVTRYFDLIAGTSTGGILAIGLGLGIRPKEMLQLYLEKGPEIFGGSTVVGSVWSLVRPRYKTKPLREALSAKIGGRKLGESRVRLVVPSTNLESGSVYIWKTAHHERFERDYNKEAIDAALATAAAPLYFPTYKTSNGEPLADGGLFANNPVGLAVVEAVGVLGWRADDIDVLSLGCTEELIDVGSVRHRPAGIIDWVWGLRAVNLMLAAQSSASLGTAAVLVGHDRVLRVSPSVPSGRYRLDSTRGLDTLQGQGVTAAKHAIPQLRRRFLTHPVEPFVPYRQV